MTPIKDTEFEYVSVVSRNYRPLFRAGRYRFQYSARPGACIESDNALCRKEVGHTRLM